MFRSESRLDRTARFVAATVALLGCCATPLGAQETRAPQGDSGGQVVITGTREAVPDAEVTKRVLEALHSDRYFNDDRVTVTTTNGVVRLEGVVVDPQDLFTAIRISNGIAGVKHVTDELEVSDMYDFDLDDH